MVLLLQHSVPALRRRRCALCTGSIGPSLVTPFRAFVTCVCHHSRRCYRDIQFHVFVDCLHKLDPGRTCDGLSFRRARPQRHPLLPAGRLVRDLVPVLGAPLAEQVPTSCHPKTRLAYTSDSGTDAVASSRRFR